MLLKCARGGLYRQLPFLREPSASIFVTRSRKFGVAD